MSLDKFIEDPPGFDCIDDDIWGRVITALKEAKEIMKLGWSGIDSELQQDKSLDWLEKWDKEFDDVKRD